MQDLLEASAAAGKDAQLLRLLSQPHSMSPAGNDGACLTLAAGGGHFSTVKLLLQHPAYLPPSAAGLHTANSSVWRHLVSALNAASRNGHTEIAACLLWVPVESDDGIAGNIVSGKPLELAAEGGHADLVKLLCREIPRQDPVWHGYRPILFFLLQWDARYAAGARVSLFAMYSAIRPLFAIKLKTFTHLLTSIVILVYFLWGWVNFYVATFTMLVNMLYAFI